MCVFLWHTHTHTQTETRAQTQTNPVDSVNEVEGNEHDPDLALRHALVCLIRVRNAKSVRLYWLAEGAVHVPL